MDKLEQICQKFILLKNHLDKPDLNFLYSHSFRSIVGGLKGLYKDESSQNEIIPSTKTNEKDTKNKPKSTNKDYLKNILLASKIKSKSENNNNIKNSNNINKEKNKSVTPSNNSNKDVCDNSPTIINDDENHINKKEELDNISNIDKINNHTIPLNEEEEENISNNNSSNSKKQINSSTKKKSDKNKLFINIIDKNDNKINIKEKILENFTNFGSILTKIENIVPKINSIKDFYKEQKDKIIAMNFTDNNIIYIETIKKITHLFFNVLSKIFNFLAQETEEVCNSCLNDIFNIINLNIDFIRYIKKYIKNNNDKINLEFLKNIKIVGNYCKYVLIIKQYNYEYMIDIQNKNDNIKINEFFKAHSKYLKIVNKLKNFFKDNDMVKKHFRFLPNMISFIDIFEMNRKIINYQLNLNFKS